MTAKGLPTINDAQDRQVEQKRRPLLLIKITGTVLYLLLTIGILTALRGDLKNRNCESNDQKRCTCSCIYTFNVKDPFPTVEVVGGFLGTNIKTIQFAEFMAVFFPVLILVGQILELLNCKYRW